MCNEQEVFDEFEEDQETSQETFVGKYFLTTDLYWDDRGMWQEGYAGVVKAAVGSNSYLIQACKAGFKQHIVPVDFFIESSALIFDTFDELKGAKEKRYPRRG